MDEHQIGRLAAKKHEIQLRIKVDEFINVHLIPWLAVYEVILANDIEHELVQLANIEENEVRFWEAALRKEAFLKFNFDDRKLNTDDEKNIISKFYQNFPSTYPLRYMPNNEVPCLVSDKPEAIVTDFAKQLEVDLEEKVFLFYLYYAPVLKLKLKDIVTYADLLFDFCIEDILIAASNLDWIIFRSMEDEWRFCRRPAATS